MLSKKNLFQVAYLCMCYIASISCNVVANECSLQNKHNQIYYRFWAHNTILEAKTESKFGWIKNPEYKDSIIKVIGKAICDCVALQNEFNKDNFTGVYNRQDLGKRTITFKNTDYRGYTAANWNALMLYNYVNLMINDEYHYSYRKDAAETAQCCYDRIAQLYVDQDTKDSKKQSTALERQKKRLEKTYELIISQLQTAIENSEKVLNSAKSTNSESVKAYEQILQQQKQVKQALEAFQKNPEWVLLKKAKKALQTAIEKIELQSNNITWPEQPIANVLYHTINSYLQEKLQAEVNLKLPSMLENARNTIIEYVEALNLDDMLLQYRYSANQGVRHSFAQPKNKLFTLGRQQFNTYSYPICMDLDRKIEKKHPRFPTIQTICWDPTVIEYQNSLIYITNVAKLTHTYSKNTLEDVNDWKPIKGENYDYKTPGKYQDLLELLDGLAEPLPADIK